MTLYPRHRRCSAPGCTTLLDRGAWYCKNHYFALPVVMRDTLWNAWRAVMDGRNGKLSLTEQVAANEAYGVAFRACQEHLRTAPPTPASAMSTVAAEAGRAVTYADGRAL